MGKSTDDIEKEPVRMSKEEQRDIQGKELGD